MNNQGSTVFTALNLTDKLVQTTKELGFKVATHIQSEAIPLLMQGKDVIAQSKTGSGKTAAFVLPILERLNSILNERGDTGKREAHALILCPTRELCAQVARDTRKLARHLPGLQVLILSGGAPMGPQLGSLQKGAHIIVGTPGRVLDHLRRRSLDLSDIKTVVLDEADRMLEMGFQQDMENILSQTPENRQTVLFSATFPRTIMAMSKLYQIDPVRITIEEETNSGTAISHIIYLIKSEEKYKALLWIIEQNQADSVIVFCNFKTSVIELTKNLNEAGASAGAIHGDLEQPERDRVMAKFRNKSIKILVATDVAARGIDVDNLELVLNFELPLKPEIYVHRTGRTGRAGKMGKAVSLYNSREVSKIGAIEQYTELKLVKKSLPDEGCLDSSIRQDRIQDGAAMRTLFISGGRKDKMRPSDILGALTGDAGGFDASVIGKIEIHDRFSYVAIAAKYYDLAISRLKVGQIKGRRFRVEAVK